MIAEFLRQEYANHGRYGALIEASLAQEGVANWLVTHPDLADDRENAARRRVFARYRGYGTGVASYLTDFPDTGVAWNWVALTPDELLDSQYIVYDYWSQLSANTRSPRVAAERLRAGLTTLDPADRDRAGFFVLADRLRAGLTFPPLILVSADGGETRVVLEGHTRITAYALAPETIPADVEVLLGTSPAIANWDEY